MKALNKAILALGIIAASTQAFAAQDEVPTYREIAVKSVRLEPTNGGINPNFMAMEVYAIVSYSNDCVASQNYVKEVTYTQGGTRVNYRLLGDGADRMCPMVFKPVTREILVDTYRGMDIMPIISVNKVRGQRD